MSLIKITLPDNSVKEYDSGITSLQIAESISSKLASNAISAEVNGQNVDLTRPINQDAKVRILTFNDDLGKDTYWHSTAHLMAQAVIELFPDAKPTIGPAISEGFYYDFDIKNSFSQDDLLKIEEKMQEIVKRDLPIVRIEKSKESAIGYFKSVNNQYKVEILQELPDNENVSLYQQGDFIDLCRGPHIPSTGRIKHFKLISTSGAYWRGDENNTMLQRIYGISFPNKKDLDEHLKMLEEAKRRDHRKLGAELDLFSIHEEVGGGLVHWHPKGAMIRNIIENFWKEEHIKNDYQLVYTPHIASEKIYAISGHLQNYLDYMYSSMDIDGQPYRVKPMNCPGHIMIYKTHLHSYREMPLKYAEMGTVYRYERSGVLHGLLRVRGFTIDDAHIFCRPDQLESEVLNVFDFTINFLNAFGFKDFSIYLATRPEKAVGSVEDWNKAIASLRNALDSRKLEYKIDEGGGAFYGPKIDLKIRDALKREWQCTTIQFDFNLPERFDVTYIGEDGKQHRPYMIHRALLGSLERFFGMLIEHYAGAFPIWLSPIQATILNITSEQELYAKKIYNILKEEGIRTSLDIRGEKVGFKIREAEIQKIPYMLIVGNKEMQNDSISIRRHGKGDIGSKNINEFIEMIKEEISRKI